MRRLSSLLLLLLLIITACTNRVEYFNRDITFDEVEKWNVPAYALSSRVIRDSIHSMVEANQIPMYADVWTRQHYNAEREFIWITRQGVDDRADTLLSYLAGVDTLGFSRESFHYSQIQEDLSHLRAREFDEGSNQVNLIMARLEYNLTEALLRYACGQRFGYIRPYKLFNNLLVDDSIGGEAVYRHIYDMPVERPTDEFVDTLLQQVHEHTLGEFLRKIQPTSELYQQLLADYRRAVNSGNRARTRLARINLERARWRYPRPYGREKYVWVNLAGFELTAVDRERDTTFTMRVCGGDTKHKTPLLTSEINHLELNPYWTIPMSIIRKEICAKHPGDSSYFHRNSIHAINKKTQEEIDPSLLGEGELRSGNYTLRQEKGEGNSLGRMIFRFPNHFTVYLHDTNNHAAFERSYRALSHGCIRLERPFDLAVFLMDDPDEDEIDRIRVSIDLPPETEKWQEYVEENPEHKAPLSGLTFKPHIPVWLDYYTLCPNPEGTLEEHPDSYGYDPEIEKLLNLF